MILLGNVLKNIFNSEVKEVSSCRRFVLLDFADGEVILCVATADGIFSKLLPLLRSPFL